MKKNIIILIISILSFNIIQIHSAVITINTNTKYQTIKGWGASSFYHEWISEENRDELIDYVMYHEVLHKKLKFERKVAGLRTRHHTREFKLLEKRFQNAEELERRLSSLVQHSRRKRFFGLF